MQYIGFYGIVIVNAAHTENIHYYV